MIFAFIIYMYIATHIRSFDWMGLYLDSIINKMYNASYIIEQLWNNYTYFYTIIMFIVYTLSIGLFTAIELYFNPVVHKIHDAPHITQKKWEDYTYFDAFLSGIYCSLPVVIGGLTFLAFDIRPIFLDYVSMLNISLPVICHVLKCDKTDPFYCRKILYLVGISYFVLMVIGKISISIVMLMDAYNYNKYMYVIE
jgi:hypothetical protein